MDGVYVSETPDFEIEGEPQKIIEVPPTQYSKLVYFLLTPTRTGDCRINIEVFNIDHTYLGTIPFEINIGHKLSARTQVVANLFLPVKVIKSIKRVFKIQGVKDADITIAGGNIISNVGKPIHSDNIEINTENKIEVKLGDGNVFHGHFVVAHSIKNSFNKVDEADISGELKALLKELADAIGKMSEVLPEETAEAAATDLEVIISEVTSKKPRRRWWQIGIEGLKQIAQNTGEVGVPVILITAKISQLLLESNSE